MERGQSGVADQTNYLRNCSLALLPPPAAHRQKPTTAGRSTSHTSAARSPVSCCTRDCDCSLTMYMYTMSTPTCLVCMYVRICVCVCQIPLTSCKGTWYFNITVSIILHTFVPFHLQTPPLLLPSPPLPSPPTHRPVHGSAPEHIGVSQMQEQLADL